METKQLQALVLAWRNKTSEYSIWDDAADELDDALESLLAAQGAQEPPIIRCGDCKGIILYKETAEGYETIHSCYAGKQVREMCEHAAAHPEDYGHPAAPPVQGAPTPDFINDVKLLEEFTLHDDECGGTSYKTPCTCGLDEIRKRIFDYMVAAPREAEEGKP